MGQTGAQIIISTLMEQGVNTVFGYPGGAVLHIYDELYKNSDSIRHYTTCHEQAAAHAADGYARATGRIGVVIATSGPGATNLVTGIANAYLDSIPLVAITGNVSTNMLGRDSFQEVDITGVTMPITKHNYLVREVAELADTIREAFALANSGRPGPVLVDVPKDVQTNKAAYIPAPPCIDNGTKPPIESELKRAVSIILAAKRPYIYCGGGVITSNAAEELIRLADRIDAPIGMSIMGLTAVPYDHPRFLGMVGMHGRYAATKALYESDLLIAVGARFSDRATGNKDEFMSGRQILQIDIDPAEIGKNISVSASITGDVKAALVALGRLLPQQERKRWNQQIADIRNHPNNNLGTNSNSLAPRTIVESACRKNNDNIVVTDVGQHQMWTAQYYRFHKPKTLITSGGLGTMGFGLGAAIGSCIGSGFKRTLLFTGDASFHMNMNEMATAVTHKLPLVIIILNNGVLGMVRQWQALFFANRYSHTSLNRQTDFVKLAEAFGATGLRATTTTELESCLTRAYDSDTPVVIDCLIDCDERVLPMIPAGGGINDIILD